MAYLVDSDVFIEAKNRHYGFDFCPAFWDWLDQEREAGLVMSVEKVGNELQAGSDELSEWASARGEAFFIPPDGAVLPALGSVSTWVTTQRYGPAAISTFLGAADYYLVAHALAHSHIVVTHEQPRNSPNRVQIPEVCIGLGVKCVSPFEMLRLSGARFILSDGS